MAVAAATLALGACGRRPLEGGTAPPAGDELAEVTLALGETPADVKCVVVSVLTDKTDRRPFTPAGEQSFVLKRLPTGLVVFNVEAFAQACSATAMAVPTWVADPVSAVLRPGANEPVAVKMRPNGQVSVNVDFSGDAGPPRAPVGGACVTDADCASGLRCAKDATAPSAAGVCEPTAMATPTPTVPAGPRVTMTFEPDKSYLIYADAGEEGCNPTGSTTAWVEVRSPMGACLSGAGDVIPVTVEEVDLCWAGDTGGTCATCEEPSCQLAACFRKVDLPVADATCTRVLKGPTTAGGRVRYLLSPHVNLSNPPARTPGLPAVFNTSTRRQVTITPPGNHQGFVRATLGQAHPTVAQEQHGDMCGAQNLCGIIPFREFAVSPFANWYFQSENRLYMGPLY